MKILLGVPADLDRTRGFLWIAGITLAMSAAPETIVAVWFGLIALDMTRLAGDATRAYL